MVVDLAEEEEEETVWMTVWGGWGASMMEGTGSRKSKRVAGRWRGKKAKDGCLLDIAGWGVV